MRFILIIIFLAINAIASATTYYVNSSSGNNNNNGLSPQTPWKTIEKVNSAMTGINPGDKILFKRGDIFIGTLRVDSSGTIAYPIVIGAYGEGEKPLISGFERLTGWTSEGANIYSVFLPVETQQSSGSPDLLRIMVTVDDEIKWMGRWPKDDEGDGYRYIDAGDTDSFTDNSLEADLKKEPGLTGADLTGAEAVAKFNMWTLRRTLITNHSGGTLTVEKTAPFNFESRYGYFLQNHIKFVSEHGEWYYDDQEKKLYMYLDSSPSNYTIRAATKNNNITIGKNKYLVIEDLALEGANICSVVSDVASTYIKVQNLDINYSAGKGIYFEGTQYSAITNNRINNTFEYAIYIRNSSLRSGNCEITYNEISNVSMIAGSGNSHNTVNLANGDGHLFQYNQIEGAGGGGVLSGGKRVEIRNNYIKNIGHLVDDIAGIYFWGDYNESTDRVVDGNIVLNVFGNTSGARQTRVQVGGIYLDNKGVGTTVTNNVVAYSGWAGLIIHKNRDVTVDNNLFYGSEEMQVFIGCNNEPRINDLVFTNNILITTNRWKWSIQTSARGYTNADLFKEIDHNYHFKHNDISELFRTSEGSPAVYANLDLKGWQNYSGGEKNSRTQQINTEEIIFEYNATNKERLIPLNKPMIDATGKKYQNSIILTPYSGIALMAIGTIGKGAR